MMRRTAVAIAAAIVILSIDFRLLVGGVVRREQLGEQFRRNADRVPSFANFLAGVRAHTQEGDSIALILSTPHAATYGYGLIRASYLLAGRTVVPMRIENGPFRAEAVRDAKYLAVFRVKYVGPGTIVWRDAEGVLVRQR